MVDNPLKQAGFIELVRRNFQEVAAYKNLSDKYQDVDIDNAQKIENNITLFLAQQYESREKQLQSKGIKIPEELLFLGNLHPTRVAAVDELITQYNSTLYEGQDALELSDQIISKAKQQILSPDLQSYDFENTAWYKRAGAALVGGFAGEAIYHPMRFFGGLAVTAGLSAAVAPGLLARLGFQGRSLYLASKGLPVAIELAGGGTQAALAVSETNQTLEALNDEGQSVGEAFTTGVALTAAFAGAATLTRVGIRKGLNALRAETEVASIGGLPPEMRAAHVDDVIRYNPNTVYTEIEENIVNNDIRRITTSIEQENLADYNAIWAEDKGKLTLAQGATELYDGNFGTQPDGTGFFFEAAANSSSIQKQIIDLQASAYFDKLTQQGVDYAETFGLRRPGDPGFTGFLQEFADFARTARQSSTETTGASGTAAGATGPNAGRLGAAAIGGDELAALETNVINSFIQTRYPETAQYNSLLTSNIEKDLRSLFASELPVPDGYFSAAQILDLNTAASSRALEYNKNLTRAKFSEMVLASPNTPENPIKDFPDILSRVRYRYNALIENEEAFFRQKGVKLKEDMQNLLTKGYKTSDIPEINWTKVVDQILRPAESDGSTEAAIAFRTRNFFQETLDDLATKGCYLGEADLYFPNSFSGEKTVAYTQSEFVNDMMAALDLPRMEAVARRKGVDFTSAEQFLQETYTNIVINRGSYKKTAGGDLKFAPFERYLFFKDGAAWTQMHEKYGISSNFFEVLDSVKNRLENTYLRGIIGAENAEEVNILISSTIDSLTEKATQNNPDRLGSNYKARKTNLTKQMVDTIVSQHDYVTVSNLARGVSSYLAFKKGVLVSGSVVPNAILDHLGAIPVLSNMLFDNPATIQGNALLPLFEQATQRLFNKPSAATLEEILTFSVARRDSYIKDLRIQAESLNSPIRQAWDLAKGKAKTIAELPQITMNQVARSSEATAVLGYQRALFKLKNKPFNQLSQGLQQFFDVAGITQADWEIFRQLPAANFGGRTPVQSARYLLSQGNQSEIIEKFALAESMISLFGSVRSTRFGAAGAIRPGVNDVSKLLATIASPFQNITSNAFNIHGQSLIELLKSKRISTATANLSMLVFSGWTAYMAKEYLRGNKPDPVSGRAIFGALMYSGILSEGGEFAISAILGGWSNDGFFPEVAALADIADRYISNKPLNLYSNFTRIGKGLNPVKNYPLLGVATNKYLGSALYGLIDPEGAALYEERVNKAYDNGKLTPYGRWANTPAELPNRLTAEQARRRRRARTKIK